MGMHILVTGGAGFIGSHLTRRLLARGDRVTVLDDFNDFYDPALKRENIAAFVDDPNYLLLEGDIRDQQKVDDLFVEGKFDAVVHLAARAGVRPSLQQPILYEDVNCIGTLRLLEAARQHGPDLFLFGSSSSVYGINEKVPFAEDDEVNQPISPYATTERASCSATTTITSTGSAPPACASSPCSDRRSARRWRSTSSPTSCGTASPCRCTATAAAGTTTPTSTTSSTAWWRRSSWLPGSRS